MAVVLRVSFDMTLPSDVSESMTFYFGILLFSFFFRISFPWASFLFFSHNSFMSWINCFDYTRTNISMNCLNNNFDISIDLPPNADVQCPHNCSSSTNTDTIYKCKFSPNLKILFIVKLYTPITQHETESVYTVIYIDESIVQILFSLYFSDTVNVLCFHCNGVL